MDAAVCVYKCGKCDRPVMVWRDTDDGCWYLEFHSRCDSDPCGMNGYVRIEDASEAVKDMRLFEPAEGRRSRNGPDACNSWYIVDWMMSEALWRLELAGDSGCQCFFDHFCHDVMHRERMARFGKWLADKKARLAAAQEKPEK